MLRHNDLQGFRDDADIDFSAGFEPVAVSVSGAGEGSLDGYVLSGVAVDTVVSVQSAGHQLECETRQLEQFYHIYYSYIQKSVADVCEGSDACIVSPLIGVADGYQSGFILPLLAVDVHGVLFRNVFLPGLKALTYIIEHASFA